MEAITKQIEEAIRQHLPQQVGEVLQQQLAQLPRLKQKVMTLEGDLRAALDNAAENKAYLAEAIGKLKAHAALDEREKELEKKERLQTIELLKKDVQCRDQRIADLKEMVTTVFKNPTFQEQHFTSKSVQVSLPGGYSSPQPETENHTITKTTI